MDEQDRRTAAGSTRPPAVAGSFYTGDGTRLGREAATLLDAAAARVAPLGPDRLVGLLVPHAGLVYSGGVAAAAWRILADDARRLPSPPTVLLAGTNHFAPFVGVSVWGGGSWRTPLGDVAVDAPWRDALAALGSPFLVDDRTHAREHSIEVQLPLLATALPGARFAPFLVSLGDPAACIDAGRRLGRLVAERQSELGPAIVVASSDLAHYPADGLARSVDERVLQPIVELDPDELARRELDIRDAGLPNVACGLCGLEPTLLTLAAVRELGANRGVLLEHATSADVPEGDPSRVVGYGAVAFVA